MPLKIQRYRLCAYCADRQQVATETFDTVIGPKCFICEGTMGRLSKIVASIKRVLRAYEFDTFSIGIVMPRGVLEREDELRATLKLKGKETAKAHLGRLVAEAIEEATGRRHEKNNPDLVAIADLNAWKVSVNSRPLFYYLRYAKPAGVSQRREFCLTCQGRGCSDCEFSGFQHIPSVEESLRNKLYRLTGSTNMKFTWFGSEDSDSNVFPPGRPVVIELKNPKKRKLPKAFVLRSGSGIVRVFGGKVLPSRPAKFPSFKFRTRIYTNADGVNMEGLKLLSKVFRNIEVKFERPNGQQAAKQVYWVRGKIVNDGLVLEAELDGGLPVKRFVSGEQVSPSISEVLKTDVKCSNFDVLRVTEKGEFEFA